MSDGISLARGTNFARIRPKLTSASPAVVCQSRRTTRRDIRAVVVFAMCCCCCFIACDGSRSTRIEPGDRPGGGGGNESVRCLPIAHDVLWKRLRLVAADFDRFRAEYGTHEHPGTPPPPPPPPVLLTSSEFTVLAANESAKGTSFSASHNRLTGELGRRRDTGISRTDFDDGDLASRRRRRNPDRRTRKRLLHRRRRRRRPVDPSVLQKTSWHCRMSKYWKRMPTGPFPSYVQTARCRQRACVFGLFECRPRRYRIKLLRRNDGACNPLPNLGPSTDYEETWSFVEHKVVVGCECSRKRTQNSISSISSSISSSGRGRFSSSRRRNYTSDRAR